MDEKLGRQLLSQNNNYNVSITSDHSDTHYGDIWQDDDHDYSSSDEEDLDTADLKKIRVIVRVRPLIQGESTLIRRT